MSEDESLIIKTRIEQLERENREAAEREKRTENTYKKNQLEINARLVRLTGFLVITSLVANAISIYLAVVAKQSADAAMVSANAGERQAIVGTGQVKIASDALKSSSESFAETLKQMKAQSTSMQDAANASKRSAAAIEATNKLADLRFQVAELASLDTGFPVMKALVEGSHQSITVSAVNRKPTNALNVACSLGWLLEPKLPDRIAYSPPTSSRPILVTQEPFTCTVTGPETNKIILDQLNQNKLFLYVLGYISYQDAIMKPHQTSFCFEYNLTFGFTQCPVFNTAY